MKESHKKLTIDELYNLKRLMIIYTLEGSRSVNGVYYNRYKNRKIEKIKDADINNNKEVIVCGSNQLISGVGVEISSASTSIT